MSKYMERQVDAQYRLVQQVQDAFAAARICHMTHDGLMRKLRAVYEGPLWHRAARPVHEYVRGYVARMHNELYQYHLVFAHDVFGTRYVHGMEEYKALSPQWVHENANWCGYVWKDNPNCHFSGEGV